MALLRVLTPQNGALLATIRNSKPQPVAGLGELAGRAQRNLTRTLAAADARVLALPETGLEGILSPTRTNQEGR